MADVKRLLIVDDDPLVRKSYLSFFDKQEWITVAAEARNGLEAVEAYARNLPDLVVMDMQMPVMNGAEACGEICRRWPDACVVMMTAFAEQDLVVAALQAGAAGYLQKDVGGRGLLAGLRQALAGDLPLSGEVRRELVSKVVSSRPPDAPESVHLTEREIDVLRWLAEGMTNGEIAEKLYVSESSVKQYMLAIGTKIGVRSRTGILIRAIRMRIINPFDEQAV